MPKPVTAFADAKGRLHPSMRAATISDLADLFGSSEGMATGIANTVLDKRAEIERIFAEMDGTVSDLRPVRARA